MSVFTSDMFESTEPRKCDYCGELVYKWINIVPGGNVCVNCAQQMMRVLLQDLIEYHNGSAVDLTQIMRHGDKRKEVGGSVYERLKMRVI